MVLHIRYSLSVNQEKVYFSSISKLQEPCRKALADKLISWNQTLREAALRRILVKHLGRENAGVVNISFQSKSRQLD